MDNSTEKGKGATYDVGYGKPPKKNQFKKGQSGNPKGRPRKQRAKDKAAETKAPGDVLKDVLSEKLNMSTADGSVEITKLEAFFTKVANDALKGDKQAQKTMMELQRLYGLDKFKDSDDQKKRIIVIEQAAALGEEFWTQEHKRLCEENHSLREINRSLAEALKAHGGDVSDEEVETIRISHPDFEMNIHRTAARKIVEDQ